MRAKREESVRKTPRFETKKSLGQHFLNGKRVPAIMAEAADVKPGDIVLEIGPGTGVLTRELLLRGATVVAIEADSRAILVLSETFKYDIANKNLVIFHSDARSLTLTEFASLIQDQKFKVVANIPYYLSGHLFRTFLESNIQPTNLVFLVQKEVAERIARDKKESLLSLSVKVYGDPAYIKTIGRGNFTPPPKVDSAIIAVQGIGKDRLTGLPESDFFTLIHAGFASKRKQLLGNLTLLYPREKLVHIFSTLHIREDVRGEDLHLDSWLTLAHALKVHNASPA